MKSVSMKSECAAMENLCEDGFETWEKFGDWSTGSSEHGSEDHIDNSGFGDWASFKEGLSEVRSLAISSLLSQQGQMPDSHDHKEERDDEPWTVIYDCFHVDKMVRDTDMPDVLPLSKLLHSSTPLPAGLLPGDITCPLRKKASFYHQLLCEPKHPIITGPKPNLHSQKLLTDTLELKDTTVLQNHDLPHLDYEKPESSSAALIQTKLTSSTCPNSPGFFYQISRQWLSQYSLRLPNQ